MSDQPAKFVWYELKTSNTNAAKEFYGQVFGWTFADLDMPGDKYTLFSMNDVGVGGMMVMREDAGATDAIKPGWSGYVYVDNVDAYADRIKAAGGSIHHPPEDIPGTGRFAIVADPGGAVFNLFKPLNTPARPPAAQGTPGHVDWHELHAANGESAFNFYSKLFHWTKVDEMEMGEMGTYRIFANGGAPIGGMMTKTADTPVPFWLYYFCVDAIDAAVARVRKAGGAIIAEPMTVPGDMWIVHCLDPQGIVFALVAPKR